MGFKSYLSGNPYRCAMLEITMTGVSSLRGEVISSAKTPGGDWQVIREYLYLICIGTVENAVGLEKGHPSPVGKTIAITVNVYDEEALEAMELEAGQRYLLYGMDYSDSKEDILSRHVTGEYAPFYEEFFGPAPAGEEGAVFDGILEQIACHLTVFDHASLPVTQLESEGFVVYPDLREYNYLDEGGMWTKYVPAEEVVPKYTLPTIAKLEGSAEEFLSSDHGALWQQMLDNMEISNHGFPVLAVDKLGYQMAFAKEDARIVEGRGFTETERTEGVKICILSESLAVENGLSVGDTLNLQTYAHDYNMGLDGAELFTCTEFPNAACYSHIMGLTSEMEEFTIVGLYRQINAWENTDDPYGFTPNTIFVPKGSITGDARTGTKGIFYSLVLHNGKMQELQKLQNEAGYPDFFLCFDQGYSKIVKALDAYEGVSQKVVYIGAASCGEMRCRSFTRTTICFP